MAITAASLLSLVGASLVSAQSTSTSVSATATAAMSTPKTFMSINAGRGGNVKLEGTLVSASGSTLTVASWGGNWAVDASNAKLVRRFGGISNPSEFQAGDQLVVTGTVQTSSWAITAKQIQDYSIQTKNVSPYGTVSNVTGTGFTLTVSNGKVYQVTLATTATVTVNGKASTSAAIVNGSKAQAWGVLDRTESTINATRVRVTVPRVRTSTDSSVNTSITTGTNTTNSSVGGAVNANVNTSVNATTH